MGKRPAPKGKKSNKRATRVGGAETSPPPKVVDPTWIAPTALKNFAANDPLCDWLNEHWPKLLTRSKGYETLVKEAIAVPKAEVTTILEVDLKAQKEALMPINFNTFLQTQGNLFETAVKEYLIRQVGASQTIDLAGSFRRPWEAQFQQTLQALDDGIPLIFSPVLINEEKKMYGIPDLLIRSDYFDRIVDNSPLAPKDTTKTAPRFRPAKYHYRVIDIKFSTLPLRADGVHLLNGGYYAAYKIQVCFYNEMLSDIQGYNPEAAYILGRQFKYCSKGEIFTSDRFNDRLGVVDFSLVDRATLDLMKRGIEWLRVMRSEGANWNLFKLPLVRPELYPNMSNRNDAPWRSVKLAIATEIREITLLWMCGVRHRVMAHAEGVMSWDSPRCTPALLGFQSEKRSKIIGAMLKMNRRRTNLIKMEPAVIQNNTRHWQDGDGLEFFVDFETINDIYPDMTNLPATKSLDMIFMIGVIFVDPATNLWTKVHFIAEDLTLTSEKKVVRDFARFVKLEMAKVGTEDCLMHHWSPAEYNLWSKAYQRHANSDISDVAEYFFDVLTIFHSEPIVIKGCFGFGLKEVAKMMHHHGMIQDVWPEEAENECSNGPSAMTMACRAYSEVAAQRLAHPRRSFSVEEHPLMVAIQNYNEMDIWTLVQIVEYLRDNHCGKAPSE